MNLYHKQQLLSPGLRKKSHRLETEKIYKYKLEDVIGDWEFEWLKTFLSEARRIYLLCVYLYITLFIVYYDFWCFVKNLLPRIIHFPIFSSFMDHFQSYLIFSWLYIFIFMAHTHNKLFFPWYENVMQN